MSTKSLRRLCGLVTLCVGLLSASQVRSETGKFNVHLEGGPSFALFGWQAKTLGVGVGGKGMAEWAASDWFGIQAGVGYLQFFQGSHPPGYASFDKAYAFSASAGIRLRLFNDETGYALPWKKRPDHMGNLWGHLWIDVNGNFVQTGEERPFGVDTGLGVSLSLIDGLSVGPYGRFTYIYREDGKDPRDSQDAFLVVAGLAFQIAVPFRGKSHPDSDLDGIYDAYDECPTMAEDYDGWEDGDGCPDPDNDGDGVCDPWVAARGQLELYAHICRGVDLCPDEPEDFDGFEDEDGCPDPDNDGDGIPDKEDACPNEPEDFDGFEDEDGCLDPDNDLDGILDESDHCPNEPEIFNGYQDEDGCPEPDRDGDGIVDDLDDCPDEPETINGIDDEDGCPDEGVIEVKDNKVLIGDRIFFDLGHARLKTEGKNVLEHVYKLIDVHPEYLLISIEGHADQTGPAKLNQKLSLRRADAVRRHLIKLGIEPKRLVVRGFGDKDPWKEERRAMYMNRRVEILIEKIDERLAKSPVAKHVVEGVSRASTKSETPSPKTSSPARPGNAEESPNEN